MKMIAKLRLKGYIIAVKEGKDGDVSKHGLSLRLWDR